MSNAALIAELTRVKVLFQARTIATIIGLPADHARLSLPDDAGDDLAERDGGGVVDFIHNGGK